MERQIIRVKCAAELWKHPLGAPVFTIRHALEGSRPSSFCPGLSREKDSAAADDAAAFAHQAHGLAKVIIEHSAHRMVSVLSQHFTARKKLKSVSEFP